MAWSLAVADADQYVIAVAGNPVSQGAGQSGYADGEFLTISQPKESFIVVEGTDGSVARSKTNSRVLDIKLILLQTNAYNAYLSGLLLADVNTPNGAGIGSFVVEDIAGTTLVLCTRSWVSKPADITLDRGAKARSWPITGIWDVMLVGGNISSETVTNDMQTFYDGGDISPVGVHFSSELDSLMASAY